MEWEKHKVKKKVVIQELINGGCNMVDSASMLKGCNVKWKCQIHKYFDNSVSFWKDTIRTIFNLEQLNVFFKSNFDEKEMDYLTPYYKKMISQVGDT